MKLQEYIGKQRLFFDGAMGTILQEKGLAPGELPETWNLFHPETIGAIHREYLDAGCNIITANTFGGNEIKFSHPEVSAEEVIRAGVDLAKEAVATSGRTDAFAVLSIGSIGTLLAPMGELSFEDAYQTFAKMVRAGNHADGILIETMTDLYELKAAVLAAKENADLPVFASVMVDRKGKLLTGADIQTVVALLEGLRVDALGLNCGFGPEQMQPYLEEMLRYASLPVLINPNAGMPTEQEGKTIFSLDPSGYSAAMQSLFDLGPAFVGGCCGTTPLHLKEMISRYKDAPLREITEKSESIATSYSRGISLGHQTIMIGEKLNPTGNKPLSTAIKEENLGEILDLAIAQKKAGAQVIEVNMGLAGIDQKSFLPKVTSALQGVLDLPLMIDTSDIAAMEAAVRIYNGKPLINSVNGKPEVMDAVFPIVKKYGGIVVGLTLDEQGIPSTPEGRVAIAKKIIDRAADYGIDKKDILIDTLTMTISANQEAAATTLTALKQVKEQLGVNTVLGVSNVSFGLPQREIINTTFYTQALLQGLDAAILNPFSDSMKNACYAHRALHGQDPSCLEYIAAVEATPVPSKETGKEHLPEHSAPSLIDLISEGLKEQVETETEHLLVTLDPMEVINGYIIPALSKVGEDYESGESFLPQLLMSAEAAGIAFEVIKKKFKGGERKNKGTILLATVKGDIHDIGKNIVKVLLENYDYRVIDLGKDVDPELILETVLKEQVKFIGLSALMTTTVPFMAKTIELLKDVDCKTLVGGAVLTQEYADKIGADYYAKDAMATVRFAEEFFGQPNIR